MSDASTATAVDEECCCSEDSTFCGGDDDGDALLLHCARDQCGLLLHAACALVTAGFCLTHLVSARARTASVRACWYEVDATWQPH